MDVQASQHVLGKIRAIALMEAAERASLTPISMSKLHALAYLGDMLSPVWGLSPFDNVALKTDRSPFFLPFQDALDALVVEGLLEVSDFSFVRAPGDKRLQLHASYFLRFESNHLSAVIDFIKTDVVYGQLFEYFNALAVAMSRLPDSEISRAASKDASWEDPDIAVDDLVEITDILGGPRFTATKATLLLFDQLKHQRLNLSPAAQLRLYVAFLGERLSAA